ncbi:MAG: HdeD family acid-resistance protein [Actinomycetota bacterium]
MSMSDMGRRLILEEQKSGDEVRAAMRRWTDKWWILVVLGVAWLLVSLLVLRFDTTSVRTVGVLMGSVLLAGGVEEFLITYVRVGWRWAHVLLGIAFVAGATWCFVEPIEAFWSLAAVFGLLLILRGTWDILASTMSRMLNPIWGLGLVTGILEILLGFWASQQFFPARAALVLLWVGFFAMFRGLQAIVLGFEVKSFGDRVGG